MGGLCAAAGVMRAKQTAALVLLCPCRWTSGRVCPDPFLPLTVPLRWAMRTLLLSLLCRDSPGRLLLSPSFPLQMLQQWSARQTAALALVCARRDAQPVCVVMPAVLLQV